MTGFKVNSYRQFLDGWCAFMAGLCSLEIGAEATMAKHEQDSFPLLPYGINTAGKAVFRA